jgi:dTDP-4-amino-4,6-dideoxygalactose transaminase
MSGSNTVNGAGFGAAREIPVFQPYIGVDTLKAITDALDVGWLGMGAGTKQFEDEIAAFLGLKERHVVATNTGTSALHLALLVAGVGPGDEVITPSFNFVADHQAITAVGAEPVLCDIRESDLGIDCASAEALITPRTKAILPLHYAGIPCDLSGVYALAERHGLRVIEDATHAFGTVVDGAPIGSRGDIVCFSFDPVKVITSIDGGALVVPSAEEAARAQQMRLLGIDKDTTERYKNQRAWDYDVVSQGFRYHLTNMNAAVGRSQLQRVPEFIANRQSYCRLYNMLLSGTEGIVTPSTDFGGISPFIYFVRVVEDCRQELIAHLRARGVATGIHWNPVHRTSFYQGCRRGDLSVTERVGGQVLTLPLHSYMRTETVERIAVEVRRFIVIRENAQPFGAAA